MPRLPDILRTATLGVGLSLLGACVHPAAGAGAAPLGDPDDGEPLNSEDLGPAVEWEELMGAAADRFEPNPDIFFEDAVMTPERLAALPHPLRSAPDLAHLAVSRAIEDPIHFQDGVFGKVGSAKFFVTTRERVASFDRLYWVMVKVLSEKYGCFMVSKQQLDERLHVTCRDKRHIVVWRAAGRNWIQFYARQYDRDGYEIRVVNRKIERIGDGRLTL